MRSESISPLICVAMCLGTALHTTGAESLDDIVNGMKANREQIRTLRVVFDVHQGLEQRGGTAKSLANSNLFIDWNQAGDVVRWREGSDHKNSPTSELLWKDGLLKVVSSHQGSGQTKERKSGSLMAKGKLESQFCSPWLHALFLCPVDTNPPLYEVIPKPESNAQLSLETLDGRPHYKITYSRRHYTVNCWVDRKLNYAVRKTLGWSGDGSLRVERNVLSFREVKPGVFFPEKVEQRTTYKGVAANWNRVEFKEVAINEEFLPTDLELRFPEGISVMDRIKGVSYSVDANEEVTGRTVPLRMSKDAQDALDAAMPWYKRSSIWLYVAGGLLGVLSAAWILKRVRRASSA